MHNPIFWREKIAPYTVKSNIIGARQVLLTLLPFVMLWVCYAYCVQVTLWFFIPFCLPLSLFIVRSFVLMHDCGHGSMFRQSRVNQIVGFIFGVVNGMPQYVWSKNHNYHHNTNGDWVKYGGVFNILSTDQYAQLSEKKQKRYWLFRQPLILLPAGFFYVLFNPRFNWILGNLLMVIKIAKPILGMNPSGAMSVAKEWKTKYWKSKRDYLHMTYNNIVLLSIWVIMCKAIGVPEFFLLYVVSTSLAGSIGILLFTIQHNFENSYATDTEKVCHYRAALEGTSILILPKVLNWFTADIAFHHLHHLSVSIPNYRLAECHKAFEPLFVDVKRAHLRELLTTFDFQLWDTQLQKVVARSSVQHKFQDRSFT